MQQLCTPFYTHDLFKWYSDVIEELDELKKSNLGSIIHYDYKEFILNFKLKWSKKIKKSNYNIIIEIHLNLQMELYEE